MALVTFVTFVSGGWTHPPPVATRPSVFYPRRGHTHPFSVISQTLRGVSSGITPARGRCCASELPGFHTPDRLTAVGFSTMINTKARVGHMSASVPAKSTIHQAIDRLAPDQLAQLWEYLQQLTQAPVAPVYRIHEQALNTGVKDLASQHDHYLYGVEKVDA
jgi:hypothetical protein